MSAATRRVHAEITTTGAGSTWTGFQDLQAAIVHRACLDYLMALQGRNTLGGSSTDSPQSIERFFRSPWFRLLCDADGEMLIQALRRMNNREQKSFAHRIREYGMLKNREE